MSSAVGEVSPRHHCCLCHRLGQGYKEIRLFGENGSVPMKTTEPQTNPDSDEPASPSAERRTCSGILVFTTSLQVLHRNPQALELSRRITQAEPGTASSDRLPKAVTDLCHEVRKRLQIRIDGEDWTQFQVQRLIGEGHKPVVLQGIGVPDRGGLTRSRILIVMKEVER